LASQGLQEHREGIGVYRARTRTAVLKVLLATMPVSAVDREASGLAPGALFVEQGDKVEAGEACTSTDCDSGVQAGL